MVCRWLSNIPVWEINVQNHKYLDIVPLVGNWDQRRSWEWGLHDSIGGSTWKLRRFDLVHLLCIYHKMFSAMYDAAMRPSPEAADVWLTLLNFSTSDKFLPLSNSCTQTRAHMCHMYVWMYVETKYLPQSLSTSFSKTGSASEPGALQSRLAGKL